jgi:hypothetical protein
MPGVEVAPQPIVETEPSDVGESPKRVDQPQPESVTPPVATSQESPDHRGALAIVLVMLAIAVAVIGARWMRRARSEPY